jgi:hypothetical protein
MGARNSLMGQFPDVARLLEKFPQGKSLITISLGRNIFPWGNFAFDSAEPGRGACNSLMGAGPAGAIAPGKLSPGKVGSQFCEAQTLCGCSAGPLVPRKSFPGESELTVLRGALPLRGVLRWCSHPREVSLGKVSSRPGLCARLQGIP